MALLDDIGDHLVAAGVVGGATGWTLAKSFSPSTPDKVVTLFETPGQTPEILRDGDGAPSYDYPGFQVRVRGTAMDYATARKKIYDIFVALHQAEPDGVSGDPTIVYIYGVQSAPMPLGHDPSNRPELTWNFQIMRERGE